MVKKKILIFLIILFILICYLVIGSWSGFLLPCPIYKVTGLYCPGCGVTRMLLSILKLDFIQAFRYNPLVFSFIPFFIIYYGEETYSSYKKRKSFFSRLEPGLWYFLIILFIVYGILRNVADFSYLIPTSL